MINSMTLEGRLTRDAELKYTQNGTSLLKFTIANNNGYGDYEKTLFLDCVIFGKRAEALSQYLTKGKYVVANGILTQNKWEDKDGNNRISFSLMVNDLSLVPTGQKGGPQKIEEKQETYYDDDIPF